MFGLDVKGKEEKERKKVFETGERSKTLLAQGKIRKDSSIIKGKQQRYKASVD